jgi:16S rRNA (guanine1207-N2)-methyltransferase
MPRIHKTYHYLLSHESVSSVLFDMIYRPQTGDILPTSALVVDYDLTRIRRTQPPKWACCEIEDLDGLYSRVLIRVVQFDSLLQVKRDIYGASRILSPEGELRVSVEPKSGAKRIASDLGQVFARVEVIKTAGLSLFFCREPMPRPFPEELSEIAYRDAISDRELRFQVRPGIFSAEKIDTGTAFLLETIPPLRGQKVLDVGCGYGAIGVTAAARGASVLMLDVDARVIKLAERNLQLNSMTGEVLLKAQPYDFNDDEFDLVLSNPPTHSGSDTLRTLFGEMVRVSKRGGGVLLVLREHLNYEKWLRELGAVERLGDSAGYKVLQIRKK